MLDLNSSWVHFTCDACSCASILQGQCGASGEKGHLHAAFFLRRWASVTAQISKLSQPKGGIFKGTFQNSRV